MPARRRGIVGSDEWVAGGTPGSARPLAQAVLMTLFLNSEFSKQLPW